VVPYVTMVCLGQVRLFAVAHGTRRGRERAYLHGVRYTDLTRWNLRREMSTVSLIPADKCGSAPTAPTYGCAMQPVNSQKFICTPPADFLEPFCSLFSLFAC
jgi:hypothetical protein